MKALEVHPLHEKGKPFGVIQFVHHDGTVHIFRSEVNRLTGDRLTGFDNEAPGINDPMDWIKSVFKGIRSKATVLQEIGNL